MSKHWKEPLDLERHRDHHHAGGWRERAPDGQRFSFFVRVVSFTFEFTSLDQLRDTIELFARKTHPSSREVVCEHEKGEWQAWHERLPASVLKGSRRGRVLAALRRALREFEAANDEH